VKLNSEYNATRVSDQCLSLILCNIHIVVLSLFQLPKHSI
jgi:hypothetical protein